MNPSEYDAENDCFFDESKNQPFLSTGIDPNLAMLVGFAKLAIFPRNFQNFRPTMTSTTYWARQLRLRWISILTNCTDGLRKNRRWSFLSLRNISKFWEHFSSKLPPSTTTAITNCPIAAHRIPGFRRPRRAVFLPEAPWKMGTIYLLMYYFTWYLIYIFCKHAKWYFTLNFENF